MFFRCRWDLRDRSILCSFAPRWDLEERTSPSPPQFKTGLTLLTWTYSCPVLKYAQIHENALLIADADPHILDDGNGQRETKEAPAPITYSYVATGKSIAFPIPGIELRFLRRPDCILVVKKQTSCSCSCKR